MADDVQLLEQVPFLAALPAADRQWLAGCLARRRFRRGEVIFHKEDPGQSLFIVESGSVRVYVPSPQGVDLTLAVMGPSDFFGDLSLLDGSPRSASASALTDSVLLSLERSDFTRLITSRPEAAMAVLTVVARRLRETDQMASDLAFLDVGSRLARKLLELAASHGVRRPDGVLLDVSLTQEDLANMIGVTRESVNRNLGLLRRLGLVATAGRRLVIRDPEGLRTYGE